MFITTKRSGYTRGGEQYVSGYFLLMTQPDIGEKYPSVSAACGAPIRCFVRYTSLGQCGHFMMGTVRLFNRSFTVSGAYGNMGLPMSLPVEIYERGVELPSILRAAWNGGGGWNGCGSEANSMRAWALNVFFPEKTGRRLSMGDDNRLFDTESMGPISRRHLE